MSFSEQREMCALCEQHENEGDSDSASEGEDDAGTTGHEWEERHEEEARKCWEDLTDSA